MIESLNLNYQIIYIITKSLTLYKYSIFNIPPINYKKLLGLIKFFFFF